MYPSPWKCIEKNRALAGVYCVEAEKGRRNCFNDKRQSIVSSKSYLYKNGKASPHSSVNGWLKPAPHWQDPVHGPYGWWSHKDAYIWSKWLTELEDDENEEGPGNEGPHEYPSDDKDVSNTEYGIPYQDKNRLGGQIYWLCGIGISLYWSMIIPGEDTCCL